LVSHYKTYCPAFVLDSDRVQFMLDARFAYHIDILVLWEVEDVFEVRSRRESRAKDLVLFSLSCLYLIEEQGIQTNELGFDLELVKLGLEGLSRLRSVVCDNFRKYFRPSRAET
jgi:hypothetical protein